MDDAFGRLSAMLLAEEFADRQANGAADKDDDETNECGEDRGIIARSARSRLFHPAPSLALAEKAQRAALEVEAVGADE